MILEALRRLSGSSVFGSSSSSRSSPTKNKTPSSKYGFRIRPKTDYGVTIDELAATTSSAESHLLSTEDDHSANASASDMGQLKASHLVMFVGSGVVSHQTDFGGCQEVMDSLKQPKKKKRKRKSSQLIITFTPRAMITTNASLQGRQHVCSLEKIFVLHPHPTKERWFGFISNHTSSGTLKCFCYMTLDDTTGTDVLLSFREACNIWLCEKQTRREEEQEEPHQEEPEVSEEELLSEEYRSDTTLCDGGSSFTIIGSGLFSESQSQCTSSSRRVSFAPELSILHCDEDEAPLSCVEDSASILYCEETPTCIGDSTSMLYCDERSLTSVDDSTKEKFKDCITELECSPFYVGTSHNLMSSSVSPSSSCYLDAMSGDSGNDRDSSQSVYYSLPQLPPKCHAPPITPVSTELEPLLLEDFESDLSSEKSSVERFDLETLITKSAPGCYTNYEDINEYDFIKEESLFRNFGRSLSAPCLSDYRTQPELFAKYSQIIYRPSNTSTHHDCDETDYNSTSGSHSESSLDESDPQILYVDKDGSMVESCSIHSSGSTGKGHSDSNSESADIESEHDDPINAIKLCLSTSSTEMKESHSDMKESQSDDMENAGIEYECDHIESDVVKSCTSTSSSQSNIEIKESQSDAKSTGVESDPTESDVTKSCTSMRSSQSNIQSQSDAESAGIEREYDPIESDVTKSCITICGDQSNIEMKASQSSAESAGIESDPTESDVTKSCTSMHSSRSKIETEESHAHSGSEKDDSETEYDEIVDTTSVEASSSSSSSQGGSESEASSAEDQKQGGFESEASLADQKICCSTDSEVKTVTESDTEKLESDRDESSTTSSSTLVISSKSGVDNQVSVISISQSWISSDNNDSSSTSLNEEDFTSFPPLINHLTNACTQLLSKFGGGTSNLLSTIISHTTRQGRKISQPVISKLVSNDITRLTNLLRRKESQSTSLNRAFSLQDVVANSLEGEEDLEENDSTTFMIVRSSGSSKSTSQASDEEEASQSSSMSTMSQQETYVSSEDTQESVLKEDEQDDTSNSELETDEIVTADSDSTLSESGEETSLKARSEPADSDLAADSDVTADSLTEETDELEDCESDHKLSGSEVDAEEESNEEEKQEQETDSEEDDEQSEVETDSIIGEDSAKASEEEKDSVETTSEERSEPSDSEVETDDVKEESTEDEKDDQESNLDEDSEQSESEVENNTEEESNELCNSEVDTAEEICTDCSHSSNY